MHDDESTNPATPPHSKIPSDALPTNVYVTRWLAGDQAAFQVLHDRFAPLLTIRIRQSRVWPVLSDQNQVDDVVQNVWTRVVQSVHDKKTFRPTGPGSFFALLNRIAACTLNDMARSQSASKRGLAEALRTCAERQARRKPGLPAIETPTSHARCTELETFARLALNARELQAWDLVEIQGYTTDEAGVALQTTGSAVRGLLKRGRAKLLARLGAQANE